MSPCSGLVQNGQCKCTFVVTHFSTFAVGDAVGDAVPLDPTNQPQPQSPPSSASSAPNIAAIAGGIAGGLVLIAIIAFLVMKARKPASSDLQKLAGAEMQQVAIDDKHRQPVTMPQYSPSVLPLGNVQQ